MSSFKKVGYKKALAAILASRLNGKLQAREVSSCWHCNIDIYPYQLECVYKAVKMDNVRLMFCDEPGLGKTIEAGLTLKEMFETGRIDNALIVCPSNLKKQWKSELEHKLKINSEIVDGNWNPADRELFGVYIIGLEYLRMNPYFFDEYSLDMVVFDEAHHLSLKYKKQKKTRSYIIAKKLCDNVNNILMLTATPIQLGYFDFWSLINLLKPEIFPDYNTFEVYVSEYLPLIRELNKEYTDGRDISNDLSFIEENLCLRMNYRKVLNKSTEDTLKSLFLLEDVIIRHRKREEIKNMVKRKAITQSVSYSTEELELYDDISEYIRALKKLSLDDNNSGFGLLAILLKQLLTSSPNALLSTIRNRTNKILEIMDQLEDDDFIEPALIEDELNKMEDYADRLENLGIDSKCNSLLSTVSKMLSNDNQTKIIIFTRFLETQKYLQNVLSKSFHVEIFNGKMDEFAKDSAIINFKESSDSRILISTEAGGEGRNLQFANIVINYDLPWNPVRLEQRIGRVDRLGQIREVLVINMATCDTVEQMIFDKLSERLEIWEDSIGQCDALLGEQKFNVEDLIVGGIADVDIIERLLDERLNMAKESAEFFDGLEVFRKDETIREQICKDKSIALSFEDCIRFLRLCESLHDNIKIINIDKEIITLEIETNGSNRFFDVDFDSLNEEDGFVSRLINYHHPKQKLMCSINDNTGTKDLTVSVVDQEDGLTYLTYNNGENWFFIDEIIDLDDTIDCEITEKDIENFSSFGDRSCGFVNKMTDFKKGPFRSNIIIARNWC